MSCIRYRSPLVYVALIALISVSSLPAFARIPVTYCSDDVGGDRPYARALQRWLENVQLTVRAAAHCKGRGIELEVVRRGKQVKLTLRSRGRELTRHLPWLSRDDGALARLAAAERLSELSVMISALLAESRQRRRLLRRRAPATARAPRSAAREADDASNVPNVPASAPASAAANPSINPAATTRSTPKVASAKVSKVARREEGEQKDEPGAPVEPIEKQRSVLPAGEQGATATKHHHRLPQPRWYDDLAVATFTAGRYRASGDLWSAEIGGAVRWQSFFARAGYQLPASWSLQGRPMEVSAIPLAIGWQPRLLAAGPMRLGALVAVSVERLSVRRLDLDDASAHSCWDLGGLAGAVASLSLINGLELALQVEASWMPAGREVEVPNGPTAVLSRFGLQAALVLWWGPKNG